MSSCTSAPTSTPTCLSSHVHCGGGGGGSSIGSLQGLGEFEHYKVCGGNTCLYGYNNCISNSSNSCATVTSTATNWQAKQIGYGGVDCSHLMYVATNVGATASSWRISVVGHIRRWQNSHGNPSFTEAINGELFKIDGQDCARFRSSSGTRYYQIWDITDDGTLCCVARGLQIAMNTNCIIFCASGTTSCSDIALTVF